MSLKNYYWNFTPINIGAWNLSDRRIMFVAADPNEENPNSGVLDMGDWFRTANEINGYHNNKMFHNRVSMMISAMTRIEIPEAFNHLRFIDLKATGGGSKATEKEVEAYVAANTDEVLRYFTSTDPEFGLAPHDVVLLGNPAQNVFKKVLLPRLLKDNMTFRLVYMPHPSHQALSNEALKIACQDINQQLTPVYLPFGFRWAYVMRKGQWTKIYYKLGASK